MTGCRVLETLGADSLTVPNSDFVRETLVCSERRVKAVTVLPGWAAREGEASGGQAGAGSSWVPVDCGQSLVALGVTVLKDERSGRKASSADV